MGWDGSAVDCAGLLIVRAWTEPGSSEPLRAHIRLTTDVAAGFQRTLTASHADAVCATVREWLAEILQDCTLNDTAGTNAPPGSEWPGSPSDPDHQREPHRPNVDR